MSLSDATERMAAALEIAGREYGKHSGPQSDERERRTFSKDLRTAALRYARAYYAEARAEARDLGLIPEYERKAADSAPVTADTLTRAQIESVLVPAAAEGPVGLLVDCTDALEALSNVGTGSVRAQRSRIAAAINAKAGAR